MSRGVDDPQGSIADDQRITILQVAIRSRWFDRILLSPEPLGRRLLEHLRLNPMLEHFRIVPSLQMPRFVFMDGNFLESIVVPDMIEMGVGVNHLHGILGNLVDNFFDVGNTQTGIDEKGLSIAYYEIGTNLLHMVRLLDTPGALFNFLKSEPIIHCTHLTDDPSGSIRAVRKGWGRPVLLSRFPSQYADHGDV